MLGIPWDMQGWECKKWTVDYQVPPSMRFSRQEYWSGLPFPSPWDHGTWIQKNEGLSPDSIQTVSASWPWVSHLSISVFSHADSSRWVFDYKRVSAPIFPLFKSQLYKAYKYALKNQADLQVNLTPARNKSQYSKEGIKNLDSQHQNTCSCGRQNFKEWPSIFHPLVPRLCKCYARSFPWLLYNPGGPNLIAWARKSRKFSPAGSKRGDQRGSKS